MVLKAAIQALKKADILKAQAAQVSLCNVDKGNCSNALLNDSSTWSTRQQLTTALHQVLVLDLDYALDQKVEQELWTLGFKNYIAVLQALSRDKKNSKRSESQALLSWCLESASGFYLTLLQELCEAFQLDLPFRRRGVAYGSLMGRVPDQPAIPPQRSSCLYICQYCLVHLGDIARYRNQRKQAESFYKHAILLSPSSGQPYNQLALLQTSRGDRLSTVFYYVRSVALAHPFPPASSNLAKTLEVASNEESPTEPRSKMSVIEYTCAFLKLHGLLQVGSNLDQAEILVKSLISTLTALTATGSFSSHRLTEMLAINLHALKESTEIFTEDQLTNDEKRIRDLISDLIAGFFNACLLPVYTLQSSNLLEYHSLPAIKLTLEFIKIEPTFLENTVFSSRLQIWPSLCQLLNIIQPLIKDFPEKDYTNVPLPEDKDLQGFLPLDKAFAKLDFSVDDSKRDSTNLNKLRGARIVKLGLWLCSHQVHDAYLIKNIFSEEKNEYTFSAVSQQVAPMTDLLKELEQLKFETVTNDGSCSSKENSQDDELRSVSQVSTDIQIKDKGQQRLRTGILKPQGSLERAREERAQALLLNTTNEATIAPSTIVNNNRVTNNPLERVNESILTSNNQKHGKKMRQNVAMQAILKKVEENSKQVKFESDEIKAIEKDLAVSDKDSNEVPNKKGSAGILSLKNQSGYPHLVNINKEKQDFITPNSELRKQPPYTEIKLPHSDNSHKFPEVPAESVFSNVQAVNKSNFPIPTSVNFATLPFPPTGPNVQPSNARNLPDFRIPNTNIYNNQPSQFPANQGMNLNFPMAIQNPLINPNQGFNYNNQSQTFPPKPPTNTPQTFGRLNTVSAAKPPNVINQPLGPNSPYHFSTQFQTTQNFGPSIYNNRGPLPYGGNSENKPSLPSGPSNNPIPQQFSMHSGGLPGVDSKPVLNFNQDISKHVGMGHTPDPTSFNWSVSTNVPDNKLPMPPNGWWPNNSPQTMSPRYQHKSFEGYNPNTSGTHTTYPPESFKPKPDIPPLHPIGYDFTKMDTGLANVTQPWNLMRGNQNIPYLHMMLANQQNPIAIQTNQNQGLTTRQKLLKENKKMFSKKGREADNLEAHSLQSQPMSPPGYSLFNSNWAPNLSNTSSMNASPTITEQPPAMLGQQSLFSGPGPSPLERLLEQQKQLREPQK